ncbi:hypothetical protein BC629DRAFT_942177 [Irpex lacteus]|nr:hypothetical protein BC629DRAFT_942177 [Irpex lacteus]
MAALGIQVFSQASRSTIEGLPEEILDHIVQDVGPIYNTASLLPFCGRTSRRCWLSCSLVCRRWHRIAAPYVFRFVEINPDSPGEIEDFLSMLSENSTIGRLIQALTIDVAELSMDTIATLLVLLPRLRVFDINTVQSKRSKDLTALYGRFKLERLSYSSDWYGDFEWEVVQLLQLFEEVGEVELDDPLSDSAFMNPPNPIAMTGRPRLTSLKLATFDDPISPYLTYLHRHDAFRHLTCLSIYCASPLTLGCVNELLLYVGGLYGSSIYISIFKMIGEGTQLMRTTLRMPSHLETLSSAPCALGSKRVVFFMAFVYTWTVLGGGAVIMPACPKRCAGSSRLMTGYLLFVSSPWPRNQDPSWTTTLFDTSRSPTNRINGETTLLDSTYSPGR